MKRFLQLTLTIFIVLGSLCLSVVLVGRAQPEHDLLTGLAPCDNESESALCYQGITLLDTPYHEGRTIIENLPGASWSRQDSRRANLRTGAVEWVIIFTSEARRVRELSLRPRKDATNIGNIVAQLDMPCAVYPVRPTYQFPSVVVVAYPTMMVWVEMSTRKLAPTLPVIEINLVPPAAPEFFDPCNNPNWKTKYGWKGFRWYPYR